MTAEGVLAAIAQTGASLYVNPTGQLAARGASRLSPELRTAILESKAELVRLLNKATDEALGCASKDQWTSTPRPVIGHSDEDALALLVYARERWPERAEEWRDVDWADPVEVATRVFGCRIVPITPEDQAAWDDWRTQQQEMKS